MTTASVTPTVRYVFRCSNGHHWTRDYDLTPITSEHGAPVGKPLSHRVVEGKTRYPGSVEERWCPEIGCGGFADYLRPVQATESDTSCGESCKGAVGPECRCSCLGANHGVALLRKEIEKGQEFFAARFILPRPGLDTKSQEWGHLK